jgi:phenylacetate-CoA ligase
LIKKFVWNLKEKIGSNDYSREYNAINSIKNKDDLLKFQNECLKNLILHAYNNVPYYNAVFKRINIIKGNGEVNLSKFNDIPILTKEIVRKHHKALISKDITKRKWFYNSSGGSTGEPLRFIQDNIYTKWKNATKKYYYENILNIDEIASKKVIIWGSERDLFEKSVRLKDRRNQWLLNSKLLNGFKMSEGDLKYYIKIINTYEPDLIRGYSSSLYELCKYAESNKIKMYKPKVIISAAETLWEEMRTKIENEFNTKLYDFYGSREVSSIAGECSEGLKHIFMFWNSIETLDDNNVPVKEGEEGRVIVTNLHNYSMPLIRYEIGDLGILGPVECGCQNILPTFKKITGRITEHFLLKDGTVVPAEFFIHLIGVIYNKGFIKKFQVVQEEYQKIKILIVPEREIYKSEKRDIENKIKVIMGKECLIVWEFVDDIPKTKSGKYLYTKSLVGR